MHNFFVFKYWMMHNHIFFSIQIASTHELQFDYYIFRIIILHKIHTIWIHYLKVSMCFKLLQSLNEICMKSKNYVCDYDFDIKCWIMYVLWDNVYIQMVWIVFYHLFDFLLNVYMECMVKLVWKLYQLSN